MSETVKRTDQIISRFTKQLLSEARKSGVSFDYAGHRKSAPEEIKRVMAINAKTVDRLLKK